VKTKLHLALALAWLALSTLNPQLSTCHAEGTPFTLYVANSRNYGGTTNRYFTVEQFDSQGNASVFATNSSYSNPILSAPVGVAVNSSGQVYVDCTQDGTWIEEFDSSGNNPARFVNPTVNFPADMVFDGPGNLYVANNESIEVYNPSGQGSVFATTGLAVLEGLAFDAAGNLWVTDEYNGLVQKRNAGRTLTTFASPGQSPYGLAFDRSGNLYVALAGNGTIVKYDTNANPTVVATNLSGANFGPRGLAFDPDGNLYVTLFYVYGGGKILKIDPQYNVTTFATNGLNGCIWLAIVAAPMLTITNVGGASYSDSGDFTLNTTGVSPIIGGASYSDSSDFTLNTTGVSAIVGGASYSDSADFTLNTTGVSAIVGGASYSDSANFTLNTTGVSPVIGGASYSDSGDFILNTTGVLLPIDGASFADSVDFTLDTRGLLPFTLKYPQVLPGGAFRFSFSNAAGASFSVFGVTNLAFPFSNWTFLGTVTDNPPGQFQFTDPQGSNYPQRFYRVSSP